MKNKFGRVPAAGNNSRRPLMAEGDAPLTRLMTLFRFVVVVNTAASPLPTLKL
jgi:hypothetical protein